MAAHSMSKRLRVELRISLVRLPLRRKLSEEEKDVVRLSQAQVACQSICHKMSFSGRNTIGKLLNGMGGSWLGASEKEGKEMPSSRA